MSRNARDRRTRGGLLALAEGPSTHSLGPKHGPLATVGATLSKGLDQPGYSRVVPRISAFYGVVIYMYWNERDHPVVHFHAYHAGRRASVSVDGDVLAGSLEPRALQFVREWTSLRHEEILANWERARRSEPLLGIGPLP